MGNSRTYLQDTVGSHKFNLHNFKSRVSNHRTVAYFHFTCKGPLKAQISHGLGPFFQIELLKTGRSDSAQKVACRVGTELTFGRGDLSVCPLGGLIGARECFVSNWRGVPQGSPQGQTLRAPWWCCRWCCWGGAVGGAAGGAAGVVLLVLLLGALLCLTELAGPLAGCRQRYLPMGVTPAMEKRKAGATIQTQGNHLSTNKTCNKFSM